MKQKELLKFKSTILEISVEDLNRLQLTKEITRKLEQRSLKIFQHEK
jgi:hypothetical protein